MKNLLVFSHLSWRFVYQRPQHLLSRFAQDYRVLYFEEPVSSDHTFYETEMDGKVQIIRLFYTPEQPESLKNLVSSVLSDVGIESYDVWYYTPMALGFTFHLQPNRVIFDSMDELSAFRFAPADLLEKEHELFEKADIVFTGGQSLYEAKKHRHSNIHSFPSSIDKEHFSKARQSPPEPEDQKAIPHPRLGFYGVVDERFDVALLAESAALRPDFQFVIIGPVVKISPEDLPRAQNIHYLGPKSYQDLPSYIAHWDIALLLFALNESTRYISPTKTPEYLSAGLPTISTAITDVVTPYGEEGLVKIVSTPQELIEVAEEFFAEKTPTERLKKVDAFLEPLSWDSTYRQMRELLNHLPSKKAESAHA